MAPAEDPAVLVEEDEAFLLMQRIRSSLNLSETEIRIKREANGFAIGFFDFRSVIVARFFISY